MSIRQLNASYVKEEDRVMFRFTTSQHEEYRLWLTRAVMGQLMLQLKDVAVQVLVQQANVQEAAAVVDLRQQALEQGAKFTQFAAAARLPLGAEPTKVVSVQTQLAQGRSLLSLGLPAGKQLTLPLGDDLLGKLRMLLQRMNETANWALPLDQDSSNPPASGHSGSDPGHSGRDDEAGRKVLH